MGISSVYGLKRMVTAEVPIAIISDVTPKATFSIYLFSHLHDLTAASKSANMFSKAQLSRGIQQNPYGYKLRS